MDSDRPPLAPRDLLILSALAEGSLHGYGIVRAVERLSEEGVLLDPANLYRALRRMVRDGWVHEYEQKPGEGRRRTFRITHAGQRVLRAEVARLERLLAQVRPAAARGGGRPPL
jgi:DNA-binding PadR family transcriptional regulator